MARMGTIATLAETLLHTAVVATTPIAGGDICMTTKLRLSDGRQAVMKTRPRAPQNFFATEASGLRWLQDAGGAPVPEVYAAHDDCLIIQWLEPVRPTAELAEHFGRNLAATHAAGAEMFGAPNDGYIGLAPLPNAACDTWADFYPARRVLPYLKSAVDRAALTAADAAPIEALMHRLTDFAGPAEPPARIHGDLWSGNVVWSDTVHLIDPAAHGGHRETDLAMLALFGAPFFDHIIAAYNEVAPLAAGWRERIALHQLHPLLVHAVLFGGGYGKRAGDAALRVLESRG